MYSRRKTADIYLADVFSHENSQSSSSSSDGTFKEKSSLIYVADAYKQNSTILVL